MKMEWSDLDSLILGDNNRVYDDPVSLVDDGRAFLTWMRRSPIRKALWNLSREKNHEVTDWPEDRRTRSDHKKAAEAAWTYREEIDRANISLDVEDLLTSLKFLDQAVRLHGLVPEVFENLKVLSCEDFRKYSLGLPISKCSGPQSSIWRFYFAWEELVHGIK